MADGKVRVEGAYLFCQLPEKLIADQRVGHRAVRLWALLAFIAWSGPKDFPGRKELAESFDCHPGTIDRDLIELIDAGWMRKHARAGDVNDYTLYANPASAADLPGIDAAHTLSTSAEGVSAPMRRVTSSIKSSSESTSERTSSVRRRTKSDADTDRRKLRAVPDDNDTGDDEVPAHLGGKPKTNSPTHRPGSGAGLAQHFRKTLSAKYSARELGPSPFNDQALAKEFVRWMQEGVKPEQIRAMIATFVLQAPPPGRPVWISFKASRARLFESAAHVVPEAQRGEQYRIPPPQTTKRTRT